jgi:copper(I)-binding protein
MKPGGYHIMLLGLKQDLKPGETLNVGLSFEKAGQMSVEASVK